MQEQKLKHGNSESSVVSQTANAQVDTATAVPVTFSWDNLINLSSFADPEHATTDILHQSQLSPKKVFQQYK